MPATPAEQHEQTEQIPLSRTERLPESRPDGPTTPMRQVRRKADDGPWPAIPMLPVIRPEEIPLSEIDRVREARGARALQQFLDRQRGSDSDAPAWPEREDPDQG